MTKNEFRKRAFLADIDLAHLASIREMKSLSDAELLAIIESGSKSDCGIDIGQMSDRELEAVVYGSPTTRRKILEKYSNRRT